MAGCIRRAQIAIASVAADRTFHIDRLLEIGLTDRNTPASPNEKTAKVMIM